MREITIGEVPEVMRFLADELIPALAVDFVKEAAFLVVERGVEISPVGRPPQDKHPGKYRASHLLSVGTEEFAGLSDAPSYPVPNIMDFERQLDRLQPGEDVFWTNDARSDGSNTSYAGPLEGGWSPQAAGGIFGPSLAYGAGQSAAVIQRAVQRTENRMRAQARGAID